MSYQFLNSIFKSLFDSSPTISGRFYILPKFLQELNGSDLEQCIASAKVKDLKDGPLVAMLPPVAFGSYRYLDASWTRYVLTLYFLRTSYTDESGNVRSPSAMNTSTNRLDQDWDEMKSLCSDSLRVLDKWFKEGSYNGRPLINKIRFNSRAQDTVTPISLQGNERRSGVKCITQIDMNDGCEIAEYSSDAINSLINTDIV